MRSKPQHIAVVRLSAMGDVAMIVPLVNAIVKQHPEVKITIVSRAFLKPLFYNIPNVFFFECQTDGRHKGIPGIFRLYKDLRALGVDAMADLHNVLRSTLLRNLFSISRLPAVATDKARNEKKALTRAHNKVFRQLKPVIFRHADVFAKLGYPVDTLDLAAWMCKIIPLSSQTAAFTGSKDQKWIGVAPFAKHQSKVYPADLMAQVIVGLQRWNCQIFLFGSGPDETVLLEHLAGGIPNTKVVAGKLNFSEELELISNLDVMLSMDSANAHLAAIYGVPTVTLWGATHPYAGFAPFNQPTDNALISNRDKYPMIPTSVYGNKIVAGYEHAMRTIAPQSVIEKIRKILR